MFLKLFFTLITFFVLSKFCLSKTDGFTLLKIQGHQENRLEVASPDEEELIKNISLQPFDYLGKGAQTYVFVSRDRRYVIKFFRYFNKYRSPLETLPFARVQKTVQKRKAKQEKDFKSYLIAHERLKEETGLIYLHLHPTKNLKSTLTLYDKIKIQYKLSLDEMGFIIQKKADPFYPTLSRWIKEENWGKAQQALRGLVQLVLNRCQNGVFDKDPDLATNFGFLDGNPMQIDIGRFTLDATRKKPEVYKQDLVHIFKQLEKWLNTRSPDLAAYLHNEIDQISY